MDIALDTPPSALPGISPSRGENGWSSRPLLPIGEKCRVKRGDEGEAEGLARAPSSGPSGHLLPTGEKGKPAARAYTRHRSCHLRFSPLEGEMPGRAEGGNGPISRPTEASR